MNRLMQGFPPQPQGQVTLTNWRSAPFNQWAFHHVREIIPTADIAHDRHAVKHLPQQPVDFRGLRIEPDSGEPLSLEAFLQGTDHDGIVILHRGRMVLERYGNGMTDETPHILMSVSKSMLGLLAGSLVERRALDPERQVTDVIPELAGTAYKGASIRQLLDMRAGVAFDEDYLATSGPIVEYRKSTGWNPLGAGERPADLRSYFSQLKGADGPHNGPFHYISPNTDLLGWVIERATGARYADLMSEHLWKPVGAERSAYITVDRLGAPRAAGGMCVTLRDLARVGQFMIQRPSAWVDDIERKGDAKAWAAGDMVEYFPGLPLRYRSQWYVLDGDAPLIFGYGIHGQFLFVDRTNQIVIAKLSSQALPMDTARIGLTLRAVSEIRKLLSGDKTAA
jgi:CubicO group peptidase (beta-lactamase class C family)